jgi:hypothetical protein
MSPWWAHAWCSLARVHSRVGNMESARVVLDLATQECSNKLLLLTTLAHLEKHNKNFRQARQACVEALKIDKRNPASWNLR